MVSGTAVMETLNISGMDEMVTLYSADGKTIALMHYCVTRRATSRRCAPFRRPGTLRIWSFHSSALEILRRLKPATNTN
jgi:hypothetical protein